MAPKVLSSGASAAGVTETAKTPDPSLPTTQEEQDKAAEQAKTEHVTALESALEVKTVADPKAVELGDKAKFLNTTPYQLKCPYSKAEFPANALSGKVEVNQWIRSQVKAGLLRVQV